MIPLQDTPAVKHTYSAAIITRPQIAVFMSGNNTNKAYTMIGDYGLNEEHLLS